MTPKIISIICLILVLGCYQPKDKVDNTFIVPTDSRLLPKKEGNRPSPPLPKEYYFPSNFIIDTGGHIYFYQQRIKSGWNCGTGTERNTPPLFIDLQPEEIVEIPTQNFPPLLAYHSPPPIHCQIIPTAVVGLQQRK